MSTFYESLSMVIPNPIDLIVIILVTLILNAIFNGIEKHSDHYLSQKKETLEDLVSLRFMLINFRNLLVQKEEKEHIQKEFEKIQLKISKIYPHIDYTRGDKLLDFMIDLGTVENLMNEVNNEINALKYKANQELNSIGNFIKKIVITSLATLIIVSLIIIILTLSIIIINEESIWNNVILFSLFAIVLVMIFIYFYGISTFINKDKNKKTD